MPTIELSDISWKFGVELCDHNCQTSVLRVRFAYSSNVLRAIWPQSGGVYTNVPYTLVVTDSSDLVRVNTTGQLTPESLGIPLSGIDGDGVYKIEMTLGGPSNAEGIDQSLTTYGVVLCKTRCCYTKLAAKIDNNKSCDLRLERALTRLELYLNYVQQLVACNNNVVAAQKWIDQAQRLCQQYNCTC